MPRRVLFLNSSVSTIPGLAYSCRYASNVVSVDPMRTNQLVCWTGSPRCKAIGSLGTLAARDRVGLIRSTHHLGLLWLPGTAALAVFTRRQGALVTLSLRYL